MSGGKREAGPSDLSTYIRWRCALPAGEIAWLESVAERRSIPRGGVFCGIGQARHEIGFVHEGILQVYAVFEEGARERYGDMAAELPEAGLASPSTSWPPTSASRPSTCPASGASTSAPSPWAPQNS